MSMNTSLLLIQRKSGQKKKLFCILLDFTVADSHDSYFLSMDHNNYIKLVKSYCLSGCRVRYRGSMVGTL